jgi:uncharacterized membrane protein YphA (DoxX/SURF4 family)
MYSFRGHSGESLRSAGLDLVRAYLGVALFFKGIAFVSRPELLRSLLEEHGLMYWGSIAAHYVLAAHFVGGLMLAVGLVTRLAALVQIPVLFTAAFFVHLKEGLFSMHQNLELTLLVLFLLIVIAVAGSGRLSLDHVLLQKKQAAPAHA